MHHHPVAVDVAELQVDSFSQAQAARIDRAQADSIVRAMYASQDALHLVCAEHHGQLFLLARAYQIEWGPLSPKRMLKEKLDAGQGNSDGTG